MCQLPLNAVGVMPIAKLMGTMGCGHAHVLGHTIHPFVAIGFTGNLGEMSTWCGGLCPNIPLFQVG